MAISYKTAYGPMLEADMYGNKELTANYPKTVRFMAVYTSLDNKPKKPSAQ